MIGANAETLGMNLFLCDACAESLFESMLGSELGKRVLSRLAKQSPAVPAEHESPPAVAKAAAVKSPVVASAETPAETRSVEVMRDMPKNIGLICPKCGKGPFKNHAGLVLHMRVHKHAK